MKKYSNYSLKDHNSLKIDVSCDRFICIENEADIAELSQIPEIKEGNRFVLGEGANVLFTGDFAGTILQLKYDAITLVEETVDHVILEVGAGASWHNLVTYTVEHNWGGIENMALIPGSVGAAAIGNIAAYNQVFSDACLSLSVYEFETGKTKTLSAQECGFVYRNSNFKTTFKGQFLILSVLIKLKKNPSINTEYWSKKHGSIEEELQKIAKPPFSIADTYNVIVKMRTVKFPDMKLLGTAGSFFKNPFVTKDKLKHLLTLIPNLQFYPTVGMRYTKDTFDDLAQDQMIKVSAGDILDNGMGYKGLWIGNVGLYKNHALTLVTNGKASAQEVVEFAEKIEKDFYDYCGVRLEREVITV